MAILSKAAASSSNRRSALVVASSGLIISMAATTASAAPDATVSATPVAGEASVSDAAVAALSLAPSVVVSDDAEFASVDLAAESTPAPVIVRVARTTARTTVSTSRSSSTSTGASTTISSAPVPSSGIGGAAVSIARQYVGTPYVYGGATPAGFDCSGFTSYVFAQLGYNISRSSSAQRYAGTVVPASQAQPGDLIWWPGHVGIYTGNGNHIAARNPGTALYESPIYRSNPTFIRVG